MAVDKKEWEGENSTSCRIRIKLLHALRADVLTDYSGCFLILLLMQDSPYGSSQFSQYDRLHDEFPNAQ